MANDLIITETLKPLEVFAQGGADPLLDKIKEMVANFVPDMTTEKGRKEIASLAYKIAQSKTALDNMGKDLVAEKKKETSLVDAERRRIRDELDTLKESVRAPLTKWEEEEKSRIELCRMLIESMQETANNCAQNWQTMPIEQMRADLDGIQNCEKYHNPDWREFAHRASEVTSSGAAKVTEAIEKRLKYDAEQAEMKRLRDEEAARITKAREEKIAAEAAEEARKKAEEKAAEKLRAEQQERERIEQERQAEKKRAEDAEKKAAEQAKKAEQEKAEAAAKAEREKQEAVEAERKRAEDEQKRQAEEEERRAANKRHKGKINRAVREAIMAEGFDEAQATHLVKLIAAGVIPHTQISY